MANVITYGTYDLFHIGHLKLLQRAKALGGENGTLTVVVSSDRFNWDEKHKRCAIPDWQRAEIVGALKCVDKVLFEDSWEQKRQDVIDNKIDIFVMGDDWKGKFDFLSDLCKVVYLPRTPEISSTQIKETLSNNNTTECFVGDERNINKWHTNDKTDAEWNLKPFQQEILKIFRIFEEICNQHGWKYWTHGGTTLGAIRHGGFIPWDDDFDIIMPREDYNEMTRSIGSELPEHLSFCRGGRNGAVYFSKILNTTEGLRERLSKETGLDLPIAPFIDIFVLDGIPDALHDIPNWWRECRLLRLVEAYRFPEDISSRGIKLLLMRIAGLFLSPLYPKTANHDEMMSLYDRVAMRYPYGKQTNVVEPAFFKMRTKRVWRQSDFEPARIVPFENGTIRVPARAEELCENQYGDWRKLPPKEYRKPEHIFHKAWDFDRR